MPDERWLPVPGWKEFYEVSSEGRIRRCGSAYTLKQQFRKEYAEVHLSGGGVKRIRKVHHLVLEAFVGPRPAGLEACHGPGGSRNNTVENLRWDTPVANRRDKVKYGTDAHTRRTKCPRRHPLAVPNLEPSDMRRGKRSCYACALASKQVRAAAKKGVSLNLQEVSDVRYQEIRRRWDEGGDHEVAPPPDPTATKVA